MRPSNSIPSDPMPRVGPVMCTDGAGRSPLPMPARRTNSLIPLVSDSMVTEPLPKPRSFGRVALTIVSSEMRAHWSPNFCCRNAGRHPLQTPRVEVSVHPQCLVTWAVQEAVFLCLRQVFRSRALSSWLLPGWTQHNAIQRTAPLVS